MKKRISKRLLMIPLVSCLAWSCADHQPSSETKNVILADDSSSITLWPTKTISVCVKDPTVIAPSTLEAIRESVVSEFQKAGFDFSQGWEKCPERTASERYPGVELNFALNKPAPFGGSSGVGALLGVSSEVTVRADPLTHDDEFCHSHALQCLKNFTLHEFGHVVGLAHSQMRPDRICSGIAETIPAHIFNADQRYSELSSVGDYDLHSIMNYCNPEAYQAHLSLGDIRSIKSLYEEPLVIVKGFAKSQVARPIESLNVSLAKLRFPPAISTSFPLKVPTEYRFKLGPAAADCNNAKGYSEAQPIQKGIISDLSQFKQGEIFKLCVLGGDGSLWQNPESYTSVLWQKGHDTAKDYDFTGIAFTDEGCSASLVRFESSDVNDPAMVLTNGHCALELGDSETMVDQESFSSFRLLKSKGEIGLELSATKLLYATTVDTDLALYQLDSSYASIAKDSGSTTVFTMASQQPALGTRVDVISGLFSEGFSCSIEKIVFRLVEGTMLFKDAMRYSAGCELFPGTSGSPMLISGTRTLVGVNSTGSDAGEKCTENNPCEQDETGQVLFQKGWGYAQQTAQIYSCLNEVNQFDFAKPGCLLPKPSNSESLPAF